MPMTVIVTRNVPDRFRGFLASCMLEPAPGVYVAPNMSRAVRERVWDVMWAWKDLVPSDAGLLLLWRSLQATSGMEMQTIGWPKKEMFDYEGLWLAHGRVSFEHAPDDEETSAITQ